jgi:hypothetical protein
MRAPGSVTGCEGGAEHNGFRAQWLDAATHETGSKGLQRRSVVAHRGDDAPGSELGGASGGRCRSAAEVVDDRDRWRFSGQSRPKSLRIETSRDEVAADQHCDIDHVASPLACSAAASAAV